MIELNDVTKWYGDLKAVDHVSIVANSSEITVLLGPNGAGKSTTIKSITGLLKYEGKIKICGFDNKSIEAKQCFGYIPETPILYDLLTVQEHIDFIANAYKIADYKKLAKMYLEKFDLYEKRNSITKNLSKGMKQKVSMILALIIQPKALLIDEPMVGLDPSSIEDVLRLLEQLKNEGVAILISTHIIDVIDKLWDHAYIMDKGKIVQDVHRCELGEKNLKTIFFESTGEHHE